MTRFPRGERTPLAVMLMDGDANINRKWRRCGLRFVHVHVQYTQVQVQDSTYQYKYEYK